MRGIPEWNFPAFDKWRDFMQEAGWEVVSPADMDRALGMDQKDYPNLPEWFTMKDAMRRDFEEILSCTALLLLPGWEKSTGVMGDQVRAGELSLARTLGIQVFIGHESKVTGDPLYYTYSPTPTVAETPIRVLPGESVAEAEEAARREQYAYAAGEHRVVDPNTGGEKGSKLARFDLIPPDVMWDLAEHYGRGCQKYSDRNWEKGYAWGLSIAALERHLNAWKRGESTTDDPEVGTFRHIIAVIWHACALAAFENRGHGTDDRSY